MTAKKIFHTLGDLKEQASCSHHLGIICQEQYDWESAEQFHKEAYQLQETIGDLHALARTCNELALINTSADRQKEAEQWFKKAIELGEKIGDKKGLAKRLTNIADLYLSQNRLDEAEEYARRALAIKETLDLSTQPWTTYSIFAKIAEKRGRMDEVREWRRKEQESRMEFERLSGGQANTSRNIQDQVDKWNPVIADVVKTCRDEIEPSTELSQFLNEMAETNDWKNLIPVIRRILSGERGADLFDGLDQVDSAIIRRILQALSEGTMDGGQQTVESGQSSTVRGQAQAQQQQGVTLPQLLELVERAAGGDQQLGGQLFGAFQQMARADEKEISALGNVLLRVLVGDKNPSLDDLPDEVASAVRGMLGRMKNK